ncbi:MAG: hydroxymethylglutaryl-CoA reductase [Synechococcaceae cyanobacterium SM2_3_1]|nr:hydroxymethylglutaryl-CoA reductase [Synechococcaceae cyanobacterium SM2_3_1]
MSTDASRAQTYLQRLLQQHPLADLEQRLLPSEEVLSPRIAHPSRITATAIQQRWHLLPVHDQVQEQLLDPRSLEEAACYIHNIENFIGVARMPIGLAGPLRINGIFAQGNYYVPLATTEATLVASYTRGAQILTRAGGCTCAVVKEGVTRTPGFAFSTLLQAGKFIHWITENQEPIRAVAESTTRYGKLTHLQIHLEGNHVYLIFEYFTADAAGQNMVTIATEAACQYILQHTPEIPQRWYVEANMSGDKKASWSSFQSVRGRKATAEALIPASLIEKRLHCTVAEMLHYYQFAATGGVMSGSFGIQGHLANGLAALYIACGQDAACVAESAVGITRFEQQGEDLYVSLTLPNLILGTVGGGTRLPTPQACLQILGLVGSGQANALAEVAVGLALAGEISLVGAMAAGEFTRAHQRLARGKGEAVAEDHHHA